MQTSFNKNIVIPTLFAFLAAFAPSSHASMPDAARNCAACHGSDGNPSASMFPRLAGQRSAYITTELNAFKSKARHDSDSSFMAPIAGGLSDSQIADVASYFSAQTPSKVPGGDAALIATGRDLYNQGIPGKNVMACASCHGADATGAAGPRLASQFSGYLVKQYQAFKAGTRQEATMMPMVVQNLDPDSMNAIAAYLQSL